MPRKCEHPRFYNVIGKTRECGLGLCCEEACRIILSEKDKFYLCDAVGVKRCGRKNAVVAERDAVIELLTNRDLPIYERLRSVEEKYGIINEKSFSEWVDFFLSLEILDEKWASLLTQKRSRSFLDVVSAELDTAAEQLAVYFAYRHLAACSDGDDFAARVGFVSLSARFVLALCSDTAGFAELCEIARLYSSEIEYSEENTEALIGEFCVY